MHPEALAAELEREPFVPLRLSLSDGRNIDIRNPGLCHIAKLALYIFNVRRAHPTLADDVSVISLRHIVSVDQVESGGSRSAAG